MVQSIQLNTCSSIFGDAENHDSSSEASNGNDDDFDDEDADDKDVEEEEEEAEADSPAAFLSPAPRAVKVTAAAKKDQDQKAIANANAKGQGQYLIPVDSMLLQSPFKKTWSRGNWTMEEDELLRAGGRPSLLSPCLSIYVSIHVCMWSCSRPPARREVLEEDIKSHRGPDGRAVSAPLAEGAAARAHQGALDPGGAPP